MSKILLNVCTSGHINLDLIRVLLYAKANKEHQVTINIQKDYPISLNMNKCVDFFLADKSYDWLAFVEQDNVPHIDFLHIIDNLPDHINVVCGWYNTVQTKEQPDGKGVVYDTFSCMGIVENGHHRLMLSSDVEKNTEGNYIWCNNAGNGCIFIKRHIIEMVKEQYGECFSEGFNNKGERTLSQDADFGTKLKDMGQKVYVDKRQRCYHIKELYL